VKYVPLTPEIHEYICTRFPAENEFLRTLNREAEAEGIPPIQIAPEQLAFLQMLLRALSARYVLEIGSLAGYSALGMAQVLPDDGKVIAFEINPKHAEFIQRKAREAQIDHKIQLHVGDAKQLLREFRPNVEVDFVFIDAEKAGYVQYLELAVPLLRKGGIVAGDNTLAWGKIADTTTTDETVRALQAFNEAVSRHDQLQSCMIPLAEGMTLGTKIR
jgi:predicted O-methyltransferase YrrM